MKAINLFAIASAFCMTTAAEARMPIFMKYEGVKGESANAAPAPAPTPPPAKPRPSSGPSSTTVIRLDHHDPAASGGVQVATGDLTGDGHNEAALLLPAVQKVRVADQAGTNAPAAENPPPPPPRPTKGTRTVIRIDHHGSEANGDASGTRRDVSRGGRGEAGLLLPAVQKVRATEPAQGNAAPRHIRQGTMTVRKQGGSGE